MFRSVAYTLLDERQLTVGLHILVRIGSTEHLTEDIDAPHVLISAEDILGKGHDFVFVPFKQFGIVIEHLLSFQYGGTLCKLYVFSVAEETGVGTMYLFLYHIFQIGWHLCHDALHELSVEGILDGAVLFEF